MSMLKDKLTQAQRNSGHLWFEHIAEALNDAGYTVNSNKILILPVSWTKQNVKDLLFRPVAKALYPEITSTEQLTKEEWSNVVKHLSLALAERAEGIYVEYPEDEKNEQE